MEVILLEKIANLGNLGDRITVKPGYGRNYLIPQGKATEATPENIARFESHRADLESKAAESLAKSQSRADELADVVVTLAAKAGNEGRLFGSVGAADIAEAVARDKNGIGYVGLGYAEQSAGTVRIVNVKKDANSPAVKPSIQTVTDGSYPIARFLYIYTNGVPKDASAAYLRFILSEQGQKIAEETGFIPLTSDITQQELSNLE